MVLIGIAMLVLAGGGVWLARAPITKAVKGWRADSLLTRSEKANAEGNSAKAVQWATASWQLQTGEISYLRRLYKHAELLGLRELPSITLLLYLHPDASPQDQIGILEAILEQGDLAFFNQLLQSLPAERKSAPEVRLLIARSQGRQGQVLEAIEQARLLAALDEIGPEAELLLTELLPRLEQNPLAVAEVGALIKRLVKDGTPEVALAAWGNLRLLPPDQRDLGADFDPVAWIKTQPEASPSDRILAYQMAFSRIPVNERGPALDAIQKELIGQPEVLPSLVQWMLESGETERLLAMDERLFLEDQVLYSARLQALIESGRLGVAETWLDQAPVSVPVGVVGSLRAAIAQMTGRKSEAISLWQRELDRAQALQQYVDCMAIYNIAGRFGEAKVLQQVVDIITRLPSERLPASQYLEFLEPHYVEKPQAWLDFWMALSRNRPGDDFVAEQIAFLSLLLAPADRMAATPELTKLLVERHPGVLRFRSTHALHLIAADRSAEAVTLLKQAKVDWNKCDHGDRAIFILALWRAGVQGETASLERSLDWRGVGPVRRLLLTRITREKPNSVNVLAPLVSSP
jgi:tetratricopeptide (TPR) repeat protein